MVLIAADHLGLLKPGEDPLPALERYWARHKIESRDFPDFEAALLRLGKDYCRKNRHAGCPLGDRCPVAGKSVRRRD